MGFFLQVLLPILKILKTIKLNFQIDSTLNEHPGLCEETKILFFHFLERDLAPESIFERKCGSKRLWMDSHKTGAKMFLPVLLPSYRVHKRYSF